MQNVNKSRSAANAELAGYCAHQLAGYCKNSILVKIYLPKRKNHKDRKKVFSIFIGYAEGF
jgi:hypothetical protein